MVLIEPCQTGPLSNRFLQPEDLPRRGGSRPERPGAGGSRAEGSPLRGSIELFAEGQWQAIRVQLETEGWSLSQIELVHDQLRQGWPLPHAKHNVMRLSGHCPLRGDHPP
ncbi:hypothetical protein [Synechococcus sp. GFB01]|uniref:hypothetical protein n=1 Tax=Synechococcus sp. GFB01 TaxID=1662190 RepID=UPI00069D9843|nr:hypothetical protein [Synechococcus sp. GFB01]